jgi:diacylglycerol kinase (ATP)
MLNLISNTLNSVRGLKCATTDKSFRAQILLGIISLPVIFYKSTGASLILIFSTYCILLGFELLNTAIENICDEITTNYNRSIRDIKDISSAAVMMVLIAYLVQFIKIIFNF